LGELLFLSRKAIGGRKLDFQKNSKLMKRQGCGVTPQVAVMEAGDKIKGTVMAHAPGYMLVLDIKEGDMFKEVSKTLANGA
jgi:hypothetical protein